MAATFMTTPVAAFGRADLPALLFPASPPHSRSPVAGPSRIRPTHLALQHMALDDGQSPASDSWGDVEDLLSLQEAQALARGRMRSVACLWRDSEQCECGGILASVDLLAKHLAAHVHAYANNLDQHGKPYMATIDENDTAENRDPRPQDDPLGIRCQWERCTHHGFSDYERLLEHVNTVHVGRLVKDHCPHKDCIGKALSDNTETHALRAHPGLWTEDRLRPETPRPYPASPVKHLLPLPALTVSWLLSCHQILPNAKSRETRPDPLPARAAPVRRARRSREQSEISSVEDKVWPIMNVRDPNDFWPMNGEAEPEAMFGNSSSSIFPPLFKNKRPHTIVDAVDPVQRFREWAGSKGKMRFKVVKKPALPHRSRLFTGMDVYANAVKAEIAAGRREARAKRRGSDVKLEMTDSKGKRKATEDLPEERDRYSVERINRASAKRATRITGQTIGYDYLKEMVRFEQRGIELGELPANHSLMK